MVGHALIGIRGGHPSHQLGRIWISRDHGGPPGLSFSQRFLAINKGDAVLLTNTAVTGCAILVEDGTDIPAEIDLIPREQRANVWPNSKSGAGEDNADGNE